MLRRGDGGDLGSRAAVRILIAAGGSGGHVFPGLALARALKEHDPTTVVHFAGTSRGIEARIVPEAGFPLELLPVLPLHRRISAATVAAPFAAVWGALAAMRFVRRQGFDVVCGMGGYVSLPVAVGARCAGVPVVLHEQNAIPGLANRLAARIATTVALGFSEAATALPVPRDRAPVVGVPIRPELARLDRTRFRDQALAAFGLDRACRTLLVFGGSHGAEPINEALIAATSHWPEPRAIQVLHVCGRGLDEARLRAAWAAADPDGRGLTVRVVAFVDRMDLAYAAADLVLCRAGASTIAELTAAGLPAVLVPLGWATAGHQVANAGVAVAAGGALTIDDDLGGPTLATTVAPLLADAQQLVTMGDAMRELAHPDAAEELAKLVHAAAGHGARVRARGGRDGVRGDA
jgi:UDP-N-acetylglucosamine--N-acetylmuramyl-(pentapeptide) pyrophosphoryl-undecaprenol N-acetylglucosamine transferase